MSRASDLAINFLSAVGLTSGQSDAHAPAPVTAPTAAISSNECATERTQVEPVEVAADIEDEFNGSIGTPLSSEWQTSTPERVTVGDGSVTLSALDGGTAEMNRQLGATDGQFRTVQFNFSGNYPQPGATVEFVMRDQANMANPASGTCISVRSDQQGFAVTATIRGEARTLLSGPSLLSPDARITFEFGPAGLSTINEQGPDANVPFHGDASVSAHVTGGALIIDRFQQSVISEPAGLRYNALSGIRLN